MRKIIWLAIMILGQGCNILNKQHNGLERLDISKLPKENSPDGQLMIGYILLKHEKGTPLRYESKNLVTGELMIITGNTQSGHRKVEYRDSSHLAVDKYFFPNGSLKSVGQFYIGFFYLNKNLEGAQRPLFHVGISREYDSRGRLIKETDYEGPFRFTLYKVRKLLLERYKADFSEPKKSARIDRYIEDGVGYWQLDIPPNPIEGRKKRLRLILDGHSGKIISQKEYDIETSFP